MGPLIPLDMTLADYRYVSILPDHLDPSIVHSDGEFPQDNETPHTSSIATEWSASLSFSNCEARPPWGRGNSTRKARAH
ncbi:hypothetical protein TNCV_3406581 [Trichonephila clavipes]|nr:hypothetical protein TNCV_3406581 [Trichonephila clavipes]